MLFEYKDLNGQQKSINLPIEQKHFDEIKRQVEHSELGSLGDWEFWELRDYLFEKVIIDSLKDDAIAFFEKIHLKQFEFEDEFNENEIKAVDVCYYFYFEEIYLFSEPSEVLYPNLELKNRLAVHLKYDTKELEHLLEQVLDAFGVGYDSWKEDGDDINSCELEIGKLSSDLIFGSWQLAKTKTKSNIIGMLSYFSGGAGCRDLDNGNDIDESNEGTRLYLEKIIKKSENNKA